MRLGSVASISPEACTGATARVESNASAKIGLVKFIVLSFIESLSERRVPHAALCGAL